MHVIGTAGHVDHGKSALVQRLTGIDPDRFEEEKRRGLTIDLGFAWLELPSGDEVGIVDVPGHERFIKNMLAGAGGVSICIFVVAANEGWMPQSAEHLSILDVLGVEHGVVALTKSDTVDRDTLDLATAEVEERLQASTLRAAEIVPCSSSTGEGIPELIAALDRVVSAAPPVPDLGRPRLWIDRVFSISGAGTVVTGTLGGGGLTRGHEVEVSPAGRRARVRSIQSHRKEAAQIGPGNRVALNLVGIERHGAQRGDAIVKVDDWRPTRTVDARIRVLSPDLSGHEHELTEKGSHLLYAGSAETPVRVKLLGASKLGAGEEGFAQLQLRQPLPLARGDRFVLRDAGRVLTFGGGEVLDPLPDPARRNDPARRELLERLNGADAAQALSVLVEASGSMDAREALLRTGAREAPERSLRLGGQIFSSSRADRMADQMRTSVRKYHAEHPLESGMPREALRAELALGAEEFDALAASLGDVVEEGAVIRAAAHQVELAPDQERARADVIATIESGGFTPPLEKELAADLVLLRALVERGDLVKIGDFYLTSAQAARARATVRQRIQNEGPITVAGIRDLLGTSRKYAVPLCEWLDATGATIRRGDTRVAGPNP